jgi:hypothetical protein
MKQQNESKVESNDVDQKSKMTTATEQILSWP